MENKHELLHGVTVVNAARGLVGAVIGKWLADLGASVARPEGTVDRTAAQLHPAYDALRGAERLLGDGELAGAFAAADLFITGGTELPDRAGGDADLHELAAAHPGLVTLRIDAWIPQTQTPDAPAAEILVQARSGLAYEHYPDRANLMAFQPATYGAALQGLIGALAALIARRRTGAGQEVMTSLHQGALAWVTTWAIAEHATPTFLFTTPFDPRPLILKCADGDYIHIVMGSTGSKYQLYKILGIDDPTVQPDDAGLPSKDDPPEKFYGDVELIAPYVARWRRDELAEKLASAGIVATPVQGPGECWDDPQIAHERLVTTLDDGRTIVGTPAAVTLSERVGEPARWYAPPPSGRPLEGVRVIDFGAFTAGPLASLALSRLGADVIKVEPPLGDPCRNLTRAFMAANRGKRSIAIDMKSERGLALAGELCATADAVVSNFRSGVSRKLGIDPQTLLARHPHLIVLECPAFGSTGPRAHQVAFDPLMQAFCGFEVRSGGKGNVPLWNRTFISDYAGGQLGSIALLAALDHRLRTGQGCALDVSLLRAAMSMQSDIIRLADGGFAGAEPLNAEQTGFHPAETLYPVADGWVALCIRDAEAATALASVLALPDLPPDWRGWNDRDGARIASATAARTGEDLLAACTAAGVAAEWCRPGMERETLEDATLTEAGIVEHIEVEGLGRVSHVGSMFTLSAAPRPRVARAPHIGEHDAEVLREIGYDDTAITELRAAGVVGAAAKGKWE